MDREDIIKLAREAEIEGFFAPNWDYGQKIERFAALVAAAEREACAKVCEDMDHNGVMIAADCATAIRARGNNGTQG